MKCTWRTKMDTELKGGLESIGIADARELRLKESEYASSWRKRGGVGAFMMLARKWDRIENIVGGNPHNYDIFDAWLTNRGGIRDDIGDLRRYLMLVEEFCTREHYDGSIDSDVGT